MTWLVNEQPFGENHAPLLSALSYANDGTRVPVAADPATGALLFSLVSNPLVSSPLTGQAKIAVSGHAVQLNGGTSQPLTNGLIISAPNTNSASVEIGGASVTDTADGTGNGYILAPGASISFAVGNTADIYINGSSPDVVSWAGS